MDLEEYKNLRRKGMTASEIREMDKVSGQQKGWGDKFWNFVDKAGDAVSSVFPGRAIGEQLGHSIVSILTPPERRKFISPPPSFKEQVTDLGQMGLTLAAPLTAPAKTIAGRVGFGAAIGAGAGATQALKEDEKPSQVLGETIGGAVVGAGVSGAFEVVGAGLRALSNTDFMKKLSGTIYTKTLQPNTKELATQIKRGFQRTGDKIAQAGYKGTYETMRKQAANDIKVYGSQLDNLLAKYSNVKITKNQIVGNAASDLADTFGALTKQQVATIQREASKLPTATNPTGLLGIKRQLDGKISPNMWIEADPKKSFVQWVNYTFRKNAKKLIETSTDDKLVPAINQKLGLAVDVRDLSSMREAIKQKGGTEVPMGRYSLFVKLLDSTIFRPEITTRVGQTAIGLGKKAGQTPLRQVGRAGTIMTAREVLESLFKTKTE